MQKHNKCNDLGVPTQSRSSSPNSVSLGFSFSAKGLGLQYFSPEIFFARRYQPLIGSDFFFEEPKKHQKRYKYNGFLGHGASMSSKTL